MLNSAIFEKYDFDLQNEIEERYQDIIDYFISLWQDDSIFDSSYRDLFPPGFIDRNRERAMTIIRDLNDIVYSTVIRQKLAPIYTYVLENMIEIWYTSAEELEMDILPKTVKTYLKKVDSEQADYIRSWFTDAGACVEDFLEAYDAELLFTDFAEVIAERFLKEPRDSSFVDILPN